MNSQVEIAHYPKCEEQPEGMPCICDHLAEEEQKNSQEKTEAEATGN